MKKVHFLFLDDQHVWIVVISFSLVTKPYFSTILKRWTQKEFRQYLRSVLPLKIMQVSQEEIVAAETVKAAWEQVKGKVKIWAETVAQMEKKGIHWVRDEERVEEGTPLMAERHGSNKSGCRLAMEKMAVDIGVIAVFWAFSNLVCWLTLVVMEMTGIYDMSSDSSTIHASFIIRRIFLLIYTVIWIIGIKLSTLSFYILLGNLFSLLVFSFALVITVIVRLINERSFIVYTVIFSGSLATHLFFLVNAVIDYYRERSTKIKQQTLAQVNAVQEEMLNAIKGAETVTRGWAATKSKDLQNLLVANGTSRVNLEMVLAIAPKIEDVLQTYEKSQKICQSAVSNLDPSIAAEQPLEILQTIATVERLSLEVERMLPAAAVPS
jgi:hypothetical protein